MRWQQKLTKRERKHLREQGILTLEGVKSNHAWQEERRAENFARHGNDGPSLEPCRECLTIARKLGLPIKRHMKPQQEEIEYWKSEGFTEEHIFPGEYVLLVNPKNIRTVRVYEDGSAWINQRPVTEKEKQNR